MSEKCCPISCSKPLWWTRLLWYTLLFFLNIFAWNVFYPVFDAFFPPISLAPCLFVPLHFHFFFYRRGGVLNFWRSRSVGFFVLFCRIRWKTKRIIIGHARYVFPPPPILANIFSPLVYFFFSSCESKYGSHLPKKKFHNKIVVNVNVNICEMFVYFKAMRLWWVFLYG